MISKHVKISTPVTCEAEVVGTDTCAAMWHSMQYFIPFIFLENCLVEFIFDINLSGSPMEQIANISLKRIALIIELTVSILVDGECPWFIFQVLTAFHGNDLSCYHCQQQKWFSSTIQQGWHWIAISSGDPAFVHQSQTFSHNSCSNQCASLVDQNRTNRSSLIYTSF